MVLLVTVRGVRITSTPVGKISNYLPSTLFLHYIMDHARANPFATAA
jgi:hypothetical protein